MLISVDAGKFSTKAITINGTQQQFTIRTKLDEDGLQFHPDKSTHLIEYQGKRYLLGDGAITSDYDTSKARLAHKLATYLSCATLANEREVELVVGCPLSVFSNPEEREKYVEFFGPGKTHAIKISDASRSVTLTSVKAYPESWGYVMANADDCLQRLVAVIDIGGLNTNGAVYDRMKPLKSSLFTISEGGNILQASLKRALCVQTGGNWQDYEIPYLIHDGRHKDIVDGVLHAHLLKIRDECLKYNWHLEEMEIVFTGGGSIILEKHIKDIFPKAIMSKNPIWDNCMGFYKAGALQCKKS